ncbi:MAG: hypothetical protein AB7F19_02885 [Candidatus Babeliales bacterium]
MRTKSFNKYLEERLNKEEIAEIKTQAHLEVKILRALQDNISKALNDYMKKNNVGFNELVKLLNSSPAQVAKIQRGEANLTLSSVAHIFALMGQEPDILKLKK